MFIELKAPGFLPILNYKLVWSIKLYENKEFLSKPNIIYSLFLVYQPFSPLFNTDNQRLQNTCYFFTKYPTSAISTDFVILRLL